MTRSRSAGCTRSRARSSGCRASPSSRPRMARAVDEASRRGPAAKNCQTPTSAAARTRPTMSRSMSEAWTPDAPGVDLGDIVCCLVCCMSPPRHATPTANFTRVCETVAHLIAPKCLGNENRGDRRAISDRSHPHNHVRVRVRGRSTALARVGRAAPRRPRLLWSRNIDLRLNCPTRATISPRCDGSALRAVRPAGSALLRGRRESGPEWGIRRRSEDAGARRERSRWESRHVVRLRLPVLPAGKRLLLLPAS